METGDLEDLSAADVLHHFADRSATGCLRLRHGDTEAQIWFRGGLVYTASAPAARARLGDRLVGAALITEDQLATILAYQQDLPERRRIGELLLERGLIDRETLRTFVHEQIADSVAVTLGWPSGHRQLEDGREVPEDAPLDVNVENLLMEGVRRLQQWEVIRSRIGSADAVVDFIPSASETQLALTPDEWSMLTRIDGASSIAEIAEEAGYAPHPRPRVPPRHPNPSASASAAVRASQEGLGRVHGISGRSSISR